MSERIGTRATMSSPDKRAANKPSQVGGNHHKGPAGWRHGSIDEGERLVGEPVRLAAERIRAALVELAGQATIRNVKLK